MGDPTVFNFALRELIEDFAKVQEVNCAGSVEECEIVEVAAESVFVVSDVPQRHSVDFGNLLQRVCLLDSV